MKIFGIPIIYLVIAVGVLGIVAYSFVSEKAPAFAEDDTLQCQRSYDFSQVKFTPEAKLDWDKCYMPQPLYERDGNGFAICTDYPEESCMWCALTIAIKYNNSDYCQIMKPCIPQGNIDNNTEYLMEYCKNTTVGLKFTPHMIRSYAGVDRVLIHEHIVNIYPNILNVTDDIRRQIIVG